MALQGLSKGVSEQYMLQRHDRTFKRILEEISDLDILSQKHSPTVFPVYAHAAEHEFVAEIFEWLKVGTSKVFGDRSPFQYWYDRENGTAGSDILSNQFCLLPRFVEVEDSHDIKSVDRVIMFCSEAIQYYLEDERMKGYIEDIKEVYFKFEKECRLKTLGGLEEFKEEIRKIAKEYRTKDGYHRKPWDHPGLAQWDNIDYLPFFETDDRIWVSISLKSNDQPTNSMSLKHEAFLKLLCQVYTEDWEHINALKQCYKICAKFESNTPPEKFENMLEREILRPYNATATAQRNRCLAALRTTDPQVDKERIEETKGGLLGNVSNWIFDNNDFQQWRYNQDNSLLWIKGDPGKGKTMLLCGIINELQRSDEAILAYFFCQGTDERINNAIAVLRGLIYMLISQQPALSSHLQEKFEVAGENLFKDTNTFTALSAILKAMLKDESLKPTILIIDGLDECQNDLSRLLSLIVSGLSISSRVKWLVSSRNWPEIEEQLQRAERGTGLSLELNNESVSAAIELYIREKVEYLSKIKNYTGKRHHDVERYLIKNASGTFLWVALVCQDLENARLPMPLELHNFPPGLDSLYHRMLQQIKDIEDGYITNICFQVLAIMVITYRPITLDELVSLNNLDEVLPKQIIQLCRSFLIIREQSIFFVHQSAKDFLLKKATKTIFPNDISEVHNKVFLNSMTAMSKTLKQDIYDLQYSGFPIDEVKQLDPDPLTPIRYSCIYWIHHLRDGNREQNRERIQDNSNIHEFLKKYLLYWLEVMSLMRKTSECINAINTLEFYVPANRGSELYALIHDAKRFVLHNRTGIEQAPLQIYCSALFFAPENSIVRKTFQEHIPNWIYRISRTQSNWSSTLQTLEGHSDWVDSVTFSSDGTKLASGSSDGTIRLWDTATGESLQTFEDRSNSVNSTAFLRSITFSPDGTKITSCSSDGTILLWDTTTSELLQSFQGYSSSVYSVSLDGTKVASGSNDGTILLWDTATSELLQSFQGHSDSINSIAFSPDNTKIASGTEVIKLWDTTTGKLLQTLQGHSNLIDSIIFSLDNTKIASGSRDQTIRLWDIFTGRLLQIFESYSINEIILSSNNTKIASRSSDGTIRLWDATTSELLQIHQNHSSPINSIAFSLDGTKIALGAETIKLLDTTTGELLQILEGHLSSVYSIAFSLDNTKIASGSIDKTIRLWDIATSESFHTLESYSGSVNSTTFSSDNRKGASGFYGGGSGFGVRLYSRGKASDSCNQMVRVWDTVTDKASQMIQIHSDLVESIAFSPDGTKVASGSFDKTIRFWDAVTGKLLQILRHSNHVKSFAFSPDGTKIASGSYDGMIWLWDTATGKLLQIFQSHYSNWIDSIAFSPDGTKIASRSNNRFNRTIWVRVWDITTNKLLQTFQDHSGSATSISFSSDSTKIVSGFYNQTSRLWDIATGESLASFEDHAGLAVSSAFERGISNHWIIEGSSKGEQNILWLPPDYRPFCTCFHKGSLAMGFSNGNVSFLNWTQKQVSWYLGKNQFYYICKGLKAW
ncbi:NACHT and WD40 domain protein [Botrytis cinerea]